MKLILDLCCYITFNLRGWKFSNEAANVKKYIILAVPHTSNWDTYYAVICFHKMNIPVRFAIKKEWLVFPFKGLLTSLGAIGVNRNKGTNDTYSFVDACADLFNDADQLMLTITPEGTRSKRDKWKSGFYHIATKAGVPVTTAVCNYKTKTVVINPVIHLTGNYEADLLQLSKQIPVDAAKFPGKFAYDATTGLNK
jgi:1-acyl-sn-glycerol-3-phosphate acyltransferase